MLAFEERGFFSRQLLFSHGPRNQKNTRCEKDMEHPFPNTSLANEFLLYEIHTIMIVGSWRIFVVSFLTRRTCIGPTGAGLVIQVEWGRMVRIPPDVWFFVFLNASLTFKSFKTEVLPSAAWKLMNQLPALTLTNLGGAGINCQNYQYRFNFKLPPTNS